MFKTVGTTKNETGLHKGIKDVHHERKNCNESKSFEEMDHKNTHAYTRTHATTRF